MSEPHSSGRWSSKGETVRGGGLSSLLSCRVEKDAKQAISNSHVSLYRIQGCRVYSHSFAWRSSFAEPCITSSTGQKEWRKGGRRSLSDSLVIPQGFYLPSDSPQIIRTLSESAILHQDSMQRIPNSRLKSCFGAEGDMTYRRHMESSMQDGSCITRTSELNLIHGFVDSMNLVHEFVDGDVEVTSSGCLDSTLENFSEAQNHLSKMDLGRLKLSELDQHFNEGSTTSTCAAELDEGKGYGEMMTRLSEDQQQSPFRIISKVAALSNPMLQVNEEDGETEEELSGSEQVINMNSDTESAEERFHGNRAQETDVQYDGSSDDTECSARVCLDGSMHVHDEKDDHMNTSKVGELWCLGDFGSCQVKRFPPPISVLANETHPGLPTHMQRTFWRSMKRDGRFVLQEVQAQPQEFFHATRENGRMRLQLIRSDTDEVEEDLDEAEKTLSEAEQARNEVDEVLDEAEEAMFSQTDEADEDEQGTNQNVNCQEESFEMMDDSNNYQGYHKVQIHETSGTSSEQVVKPVRDCSDYVKGSEGIPGNITIGSEDIPENIKKRDELRQEYQQSHFSSSSGFDTTMHVLSPQQPFLKLPYPTVLQMVQ